MAPRAARNLYPISRVAGWIWISGPAGVTTGAVVFRYHTKQDNKPEYLVWTKMYSLTILNMRLRKVVKYIWFHTV